MTELQERIVKCLALNQRPAQIASELGCSVHTVARIRKCIYGPVIRLGAHERSGKRHWASILLEREVLRGELPVGFLPQDSEIKGPAQ